MPRWQRWIGTGLVALALVSCATGQASYLKGAADRASQAEIAARLGPPHTTWELQTGETLWVYRYGVKGDTGMGGIRVAGPGWVIGSGSRCVEYLLRFDPAKILRAWTQQAC